MKNYSLLLLLCLTISNAFAQFGQNFFINSTPNVNEQVFISEKSFAGSSAIGKYSVWYGCEGNGTQRNHIAKPFIWIEGINLTPYNAELSNNVGVDYRELYLNLLRDGFDIIQLDFVQNPQFIQRNAELLITLIHTVQNEMNSHNSNHEIVIMGESMGAVLTRYALTKMEHDGEDHNVRLYISFDGPQTGANVPWGLQYFVEDLLSEGIFGTINDTFGSGNLLGLSSILSAVFVDVLNTEAAFQLLRDGPDATATFLRANFMIDLISKGNYPNNCRKIALANGSNNGVGIPVEGDNHQVLRLDLPSSDRRANASPGVEILNIGTRIVYSKITPALINSKVRFYPVGLPNWDTAPGGTFLEDQTVLNGAARTRPFCFVPTVSALGINTSNPSLNISSTIPNFGLNFPNAAYTFNNPITPFDAIWADGNNDFHVAFEGEDFLLNEISPENLFIQNKVVPNGDAKIYEARNRVTLGKEVTPAFQIGNVEFQSGSSVIVRAGTEIILDNGWIDNSTNSEYLIDFYDCQ